MEDTMNNQANFMETLRSVAQIAKVSGGTIKREDIKTYFKDMDLTEEQEELVYQYLLNQPEEEDVQPEEETEETTEEETLEEASEEPVNDKLSDSIFFQMYMEDLEELQELSSEEEFELYEKLLTGDLSVAGSISDHWLKKVIEQAKQYLSRNVNMEDVIQEGNIGLLCGINSLAGASITAMEVPDALRASIKEAMELYIDESVIEEDLENTIVAKSNLVYEARKALAENLGHVPTIEELCNYTNMPPNEIQDILSLAETSKKA